MTDSNDSNANGAGGRDDFGKALNRIGGGLINIFGRVSQKKDTPARKDLAEFFSAVRANKPDIVKQFLARNGDPNIFNENGETALLLAARDNRPDIARILIEAGADPKKAAKESKKTPIEEAVNYGRVEMAMFLAQNGGYVGGILSGGRSLLHRACEKGKADIVRALMQAGADGNERTENGATPLIIAVQLRQTAVAEALLDFQDVVAGMNTLYAATDELQRSAFQLAIERGDAKMRGKMIARGALVNQPDKNGATPLETAIAQGDPALVAMLVQARADLNGNSAPLVFACHTGDIRNEKAREKIVKILLDAGADTDHLDANTGLGALHAAVLSPDTLGLLLKNAANINLRHGEDARTPLIQAVHQRAQEAVEMLLEKNANPKLTDAHGKSALVYARENGDLAITALLEKAMERDLVPETGKSNHKKEWRF